MIHMGSNIVCVLTFKDHRTNLVKGTYDIHTKGNLVKIVYVDHLVQGVKLWN